MTLWEQIKQAFKKFKEAVLGVGIGAALMALFVGQVFTAVAIGTITYVFWRNQKGEDELVGTTTTAI
ncbi:hypothetical protein D3C85_567400 [compost metagenome]